MKKIEVDKYWFAMGEIENIINEGKVLFLKIKMPNCKVITYECCESTKEIYENLRIGEHIAFRFDFKNIGVSLIKEIIQKNI